MQKDRDLSFDAFRGLAIIAVVVLHVIYLSGYWSSRFLFYCQLSDFGVPAFIFISGYWAAKKPVRSLQDYKTYLTQKLTRILIPYLFWSLLLLAYAAIRTGNVNVREIIFKLLTGKAIFPYFFIILVAQFYVITPLLHYINRRPCGLILVLMVNVISLLLRYLSRLRFNFWFPSVSLFYSWIIFYEIGLLVGSSDTKIFAAKKGLLFILPASLVCLLISNLEGTIILSKYNDLDFAAHALKYSTLMYSACIIFSFLFVREYFHHWPKLLVTIGHYSFGIYLMHVPVLTCVVRVLEETKIYLLPALYQIVVGLITISVCLALIVTIRMLLPKPFCRSVFGF
jgi:surface polysaccharide O-acyltransferase-like enzyme